MNEWRFSFLHENPKTYQCRRCSDAFQAFPIGRHWYCEPCRLASYAAQRGAKKWLGLAIRSGRLLQARTYRCVDCREKWATAWEHRDYDKPLDVDPTCDSCNFARGPAFFRLPDISGAQPSTAANLIPEGLS